MRFLFAVKLNRCKLIRETKQSGNTPEASSEAIKIVVEISIFVFMQIL